MGSALIRSQSADGKDAIMESLSLHELRAVLRSIERALECSVCLECIRGSATICGNGHGVCKPCCKQLVQCPLCRTPFTNINPSMLNSVISSIPHACAHAEGGCDTVVLPYKNSDHERLCGYRPTTCWLKGCLWNGLVNDILNHLQCDHPTTTVYSNDNRVCEWHNIDQAGGYQCIAPIYAFGFVIWARVSRVTASSDILMTFHVVPSKVVPKLLAVVSFKRGEIEFTNTVTVVEKRPLDSVSETERLTLSCARIKLFTTARGVLVHSLKIVRNIE